MKFTSEVERIYGKCESCGAEVESITVDQGIGHYEFWGAPGNDVQLCELSPCCEAEVIE